MHPLGDNVNLCLHCGEQGWRSLRHPGIPAWANGNGIHIQACTGIQRARVHTQLRWPAAAEWRECESCPQTDGVSSTRQRNGSWDPNRCNQQQQGLQQPQPLWALAVFNVLSRVPRIPNFIHLQILSAAGKFMPLPEHEANHTLMLWTN